MNATLLFTVSLGIGGGAVWRALFVAALALTAFALMRYWQSLAGQSRRTRAILVGLRAVALVLLASALAGGRVEYDSVTEPQVMIYSAKDDESEKVDESERAAHEASARLTAALRARNFAVVEGQSSAFAVGTDETQPMLASVVLTDGAMTAREARLLIERASRLTGGAPVYVMTDFAATTGTQVSLESITVMSRPVRGVPLSVRCLVHARGMRGRASLVTIQDDAQVRSSAEARWNSDDERQVLTLEVVPKSAGWINYTARVEDSGAGADAETLSRGFAVYAAEKRQRVLFFEGEPTWEAKFIRRALEEAELFEVDYFAQVSRAAVLGLKEEAAEESGTDEGKRAASSGKNESSGPDAKLRAALSSSARLNLYDCIIIGATPDAMLSGAESTRLREWVERRGGGLIVLGSNAFAGSVAAPNSKLYALLPATIDSSSLRTDAGTQAGSAPVAAEKPRASMPLTPTRAGAGGPLRGFLSASEGGQKQSFLTGEGLRLVDLRAGASVLAVNSAAAGADGTSESGMPLMAARRNGAGRTILFAPADSWRIRTGASGAEAEKGGPFAALWQGIALWAASTAREPVEVALSDESPAAGNTVTAELRVRDDGFGPLKIEKLNARLHSLNEDAGEASTDEPAAREIAFAPDASDASIWRARFVVRETGKFNLDIEYTAQGRAGAAEKYFAVVTGAPSAEGASRDTLRRVARETGGDIFQAAALNSLMEKIQALPQSRERVRRTWELRAFWPLALIIPLLLCAEWLKVRMKAEG